MGHSGPFEAIARTKTERSLEGRRRRRRRRTRRLPQLCRNVALWQLSGRRGHGRLLFRKWSPKTGQLPQLTIGPTVGRGRTAVCRARQCCINISPSSLSLDWRYGDRARRSRQRRVEAGARGRQAHERMEAEKESFKGGELDRLREERHTDGRTAISGRTGLGRRRRTTTVRAADGRTSFCALRSPPLARPAADYHP